MKKYLLLFILLFTFTISVHAECEDPELQTYIQNVELKLKMVESSDIDYLYYIYVNPKRDDIELKATNTLYGGETKGIELEGNLGIPSRIHFEEKTYTIDIYAKKNASACAGELLISLPYTVPPYNNYANTQFCVDNPDIEMCQTMADTKDMSNEEFAQKVEELENKEEESERNLLEIIFFDYLIWLLVPALLFGIIYNRKINKVKKVKENE